MRSKSKPELQTQLKELKAELALLRVAKVTGKGVLTEAESVVMGIKQTSGQIICKG